MSQSLRILLVADDPEVIRRIGHGLQRQDSGLILIEGADTLGTARRRLGSGAYDLALVDLALGDGDGLHLLSGLLEIAPELPIVAVAADAGAPDMEACAALGAHDRLAPEALESAGLLDRLRSAAARARAQQAARTRNQHVAASLRATGDLAWHYEHGEDDVWLAAEDTAAWQLPGPECRESLDALRARIHPDDREMALRRLGEVAKTSQPWQLEARVKAGRGAYRWCLLRGRSELDERGGLVRASGVLSDVQRQQKVLRDIKQAKRFLRAVFDSDHAPQAILDSSAVITDCNQAWLALDHLACHAGREFKPGRTFAEAPADGVEFGDLDVAALARGVRQVLGGVVEQFSCEYGDGEHRWRIGVSPLLNPGIAGAVVRHEEVTSLRRGEIEALSRLEGLERDLASIGGPLFRVAADFAVLACNEDASTVGRAPLVGRDVLRVLARVHADAVGSALAAISAGARAAVRDSKPADGQVFRWLVTTRRDADGEGDGFVVHGVDVSDLAAQPAAVATPLASDEEVTALRGELERERQQLAAARQALVAATQESESLGARVAEEKQRATEEKRRIEELRRAVADAEARQEELLAGLEQARRQAKDAERGVAEARQQAEELQRQADEERRRAVESEQAGSKLAAALEAERSQHRKTRAALTAAEQVPAALRVQLDKARNELRENLHDLVHLAFKPLLDEDAPGADVPGPRKNDRPERRR